MSSKLDFQMAETQCRRASRLLKSLDALVMPWVLSQEWSLGAFLRLMKRKRDIADRFPEDWRTQSAAQVAAGQLYIHPARIRKLLRALRPQLSEEQAEFLKEFVEASWYYTPFAVQESPAADFFSIQEAGTGRERLLYSPAVRESTRTGVNLFLSLVFHNGICLQTYGPVHYYRGYQPFDFHYFARQLAPELYREQGLSAVIAAEPGSFLLLDVNSEIPPVGHRGELIEVHDHEAHVDGFDSGRYAGEELELESMGEVTRLKLSGEDSPLRNAYVFYDRAGGTLLAHATNARLYGRLRELLAGQVALPEEPDWRASMNMIVSARQILKKAEPSAAYIELFEEEPGSEPTSAEKEQLERLNAFMAELSDHRNHGRGYTLEELAARHGISPQTARQIEEQSFLRHERLAQLAIDGGLAGYVPPSPAMRQFFDQSPWDSGLFVFLESPRVRQLYADLQEELSRRAEELNAAGQEVDAPPASPTELGDWVEDLYSERAEQQDFTLLNSSLHLLCSRGEDFEPVRDYAVEALRLFWQVWVPGGEPETCERFIRRYGGFCRKILVAGGLAEIERGVPLARLRAADFGIRPTAFLRAWAKPGPQR
jgi:transcriptional regulator with XRE-family HTH domain